jgi:hypothetical protein
MATRILRGATAKSSLSAPRINIVSVSSCEILVRVLTYSIANANITSIWLTNRPACKRQSAVAGGRGEIRD